MSSTLHSADSTVVVDAHHQKPVPWYNKLKGHKTLMLILMSSAMMLDIINVASVTITLPKMLDDVGYEPTQLQWVVSAYALAYSGFLLIGGRFGDLFGHRRIFISGVTFFAIWSLVNGFARNPVFMSISRALQGMGAGFTIPSALAILTTTYPVGPERTRAIAIFGGSGAVGSVIGVLLGGIFGATIGWQWIFFLTAIIGVVMVIVAFLVIPGLTHIPPADKRIDIFGALAYVGGIVLVIYYLSESPSVGWGSGKTLAPFVVGIALLVSFVVIEFKIAYPMMPPHIWRSRRFMASTITAVFITASIQTLIFFTSLTFQNVLGYTPLQTALAYIVHGVGLIVGVAILTKLMAYVRTKILVLIGWLFVIASCFIFTLIDENTSYWRIPFPALIVNLIGMCPVWVCTQVNAVADAADEDQGVVGSIYNAALQIGGPIGIAIATVVENKVIDVGAKGADLMPGYRATFYAMAIFSGIGFLVVLVLAANQDPVPAAPKSEAELAAIDAIAEDGDPAVAASLAAEIVGEELHTASPSINESDLEKGSAIQGDKQEYDEPEVKRNKESDSSSTLANRV